MVAAKIGGLITSVIMIIVGIVLIFNIVGGSSNTLTTSANNISGSGLPFASMFSSNGVVLMVFMAGILLICVGLVMGGVSVTRMRG